MYIIKSPLFDFEAFVISKSKQNYHLPKGEGYPRPSSLRKEEPPFKETSDEARDDYSPEVEADDRLELSPIVLWIGGLL